MHVWPLFTYLPSEQLHPGISVFSNDGSRLNLQACIKTNIISSFKNCYSNPASQELKSWVCVTLVHTEVLMPQVSAVTYTFPKQTPQQSPPQLSNKQQVPQQQQVESHLMMTLVVIIVVTTTADLTHDQFTVCLG